MISYNQQEVKVGDDDDSVNNVIRDGTHDAIHGRKHGTYVS